MPLKDRKTGTERGLQRPTSSRLDTHTRTYSMPIKKVHFPRPGHKFYMGHCSNITDLLARLSIYFLSEPSPAFAPLIKPLFNLRAIPESLLVILLDWTEPWQWIRQLRDWIRFLRSITSDLSDEAQEAVQTTMKEWQQRKRGRVTNDAGAVNGTSENNVSIPLSQGEWDEPLGLPLCVVCHGVCCHAGIKTPRRLCSSSN